jgi:hypothetical protein
MTEQAHVGGEVLARLAHLQPLLAGRRVLVLGDAADGAAAAAFLSERSVAVVRTAPDESGLGSAAHDLVVLAAPLDPAAPARVAALRALLSPGGVLAAAATPGGRDAVAAELRAAFPSVEVAGIWPLAAWAVAPSGSRPGAVTWDGSMVAGAPASSYLFLCGGSPTGLATATVAALPVAPREAGSREEARASAEVRALLDQADVALAVAYGELAGASARIAAEASRAGEAEGRAREVEEAALRDRADRAAAAAREADLEAELVALLWRKDEAEEALARAVAERDRLAAATRDGPGASGEDDVPDLLPG